MTAARGYRFPKREQRGVLAGLRGGQLTAVVVGLLAGMSALRMWPGAGGALIGCCLALAGAAVALVPLGGAAIETWLPVGVAFAVRRAAAGRSRSEGRLGRHSRSGGLLERWTRASIVTEPLGQSRPSRHHPVLAGCTLAALPTLASGPHLGALVDRRHGRVTAALEVEPVEFVLLGSDDQDAAAAHWAGALAALARLDPLLRVQWLTRSEPVPGGLRRQRVYVMVTVHLDDIHRMEQVADAAGTELDRGGLLARPLPAVELEGLLARVAGADGPSPPWPLAVRDRWSTVSCDGWTHAVFWVAEWPGVSVRPSFLVPLVCSGDSVRTVSATLAPIPPGRAARQAEAARTAEVAEAERRRRRGILLTARRRLEQHGLETRESELAQGHAPYRLNGFVAASVPGPPGPALDEACAVLDQDAARAGLEIRRLYGRQAEALSWLLPLGRGVA